MWYQISCEDAYLLIGSARCRIHEIDRLLRRGGLKPFEVQNLGVERNALLRLCDSLYDDGYADCLVCNPRPLS